MQKTNVKLGYNRNEIRDGKEDRGMSKVQESGKNKDKTGKGLAEGFRKSNIQIGYMKNKDDTNFISMNKLQQDLILAEVKP